MHVTVFFHLKKHKMFHHWQLIQLCMIWASELCDYSNIDLVWQRGMSDILPYMKSK